MAYSEVLAERMRDALAKRNGIEERKMFGGLCFMLDGNMLCGVSGSGGDRFMFRVGKERQAEALERPGASAVAFSGRKMGGIVWVEADAALDAGLESWIELAGRFVAALPKK